MSAREHMNGAEVYLELGAASLKILNGNEPQELALEREPDGRLTTACREQVIAALRNSVRKKGWQTRLRAVCALNARGALLRRLTVPAAGKDELRRLLLLQIESEFPLPPDELAWGYRELGGGNGHGNGAAKGQDILVAAAKKQLLEEPSELLASCGLSPEFTLAALARASACPQPLGTCAILEIGRRQSELAVFENGVPASVRNLAWGGDNITLAIRNKLGVSQEEAEKLKLKLDSEPAGNGESGQLLLEAVNAAFDELTAAIKANWSGNKLYLAGRTVRNRDIAARLGRSLGGIDCERLDAGPDFGHSAAIRGLKQAAERDGASQLIFFQSQESVQAARQEKGVPWQWIARAAALAAIVALFPYAEALVLKGRLAKKLAEVKEAGSRLEMIDQEQAFLAYLKENTPPYLNAIYLVAGAADHGTHIDSLNMTRRGEVALKGTMGSAQAVTDFRTKLVKSGFFSSVSVEDQSPAQGQGPDQRKLNVRISAEWKGAPAREALDLALGPGKEELEKLKEQTKNLVFAQPGMMGGPMGMPMGMPPEMQMMLQQQMPNPRPSSRSNSSPRRSSSRPPPTVFPGQLPPGVVIQMNP